MSGWWGYDTMIIENPNGNELSFPYPKRRSGHSPHVLAHAFVAWHVSIARL